MLISQVIMARKVKNEIGNVYGRLTVIKQNGYKYLESGKSHAALWLCQCACGNKIDVSGIYLRAGLSKSCGCHIQERRKERVKRTGRQPKSESEKAELSKLKLEIKSLAKKLRIDGFTIGEIAGKFAELKIPLRNGSHNWKDYHVRRLFSSDAELNKIHHEIDAKEQQEKEKAIEVIKNLRLQRFSCSEIASELMKLQIQPPRKSENWEEHNVYFILNSLPKDDHNLIKLKPGKKPIDRTGKRFGTLTVIKYKGTDSHSRSGLYLCKCDCGNEMTLPFSSLRQRKFNTKCNCTKNNNGQLVLDKKKEAKLKIKELITDTIKALISEGLNYSKIAEELTKRNIPRLNGDLKKWNYKSVYFIADNFVDVDNSVRTQNYEVKNKSSNEIKLGSHPENLLTLSSEGDDTVKYQDMKNKAYHHDDELTVHPENLLTVRKAIYTLPNQDNHNDSGNQQILNDAKVVISQDKQPDNDGMETNQRILEIENLVLERVKKAKQRVKS